MRLTSILSIVAAYCCMCTPNPSPLTDSVRFDTAKLRKANEVKETTPLRLMSGEKIKPGGYFEPVDTLIPGIHPSGDIDSRTMRKSPYYTADTILINYIVLFGGKIDVQTITFDLGPPLTENGEYRYKK